MIEIISITFIASIIAIAYQIMIMPGELLQRWARFINTYYEGSIFRKLILCPYCIGGQIALWISVALTFKTHEVYFFLSVPCTIVAVYFFVKHNFKS
jgi:hypothetical protein